MCLPAATAFIAAASLRYVYRFPVGPEILGICVTIFAGLFKCAATAARPQRIAESKLCGSSAPDFGPDVFAYSLLKAFARGVPVGFPAAVTYAPFSACAGIVLGIDGSASVSEKKAFEALYFPVRRSAAP